MSIVSDAETKATLRELVRKAMAKYVETMTANAGYDAIRDAKNAYYDARAEYLLYSQFDDLFNLGQNSQTHNSNGQGK